MEKREIFLGENKSKLAISSDSNLSLKLEKNERLLPYDSSAEALSLYELYNAQRDTCDKYRVIVDVKPYCSNVLFNAVTEPIWKEGSNSAVSLVYKSVNRNDTKIFPNETLNTTNDINKRHAINDTEYTHKDIGGFVYHCGYDIFDNHLLRTNDFLHNIKISANKSEFNTISDYIIDSTDNIVEEKIQKDGSGITLTQRHMYQYDNILTMRNAFMDKLSEENGWYGFINPTNIDLPNGKLNSNSINVNRVMNNNKGCEFIDFYPDRSLFSFVPKVNKYRKRLEKNWDYCLTYPYKSDYDKFNDLNGNKYDALLVLSAKTEEVYSGVGTKHIRMTTLFDNGFNKGDYIRFYYDSGGTLTRYYSKVRVKSIGDSEGYNDKNTFTADYGDIASFYQSGMTFYVKKEVSGLECSYYFRRFKKIKNGNDELRSEINKTAYEETIYGDRCAQIIYTDDVNTEGLKDNIGRPVSSLYLTIIKTNKGYKEWYEKNITSAETIEYSHCFGELTSGFDLGDRQRDYNVRQMHNIQFKNVTGKDYTDGTKIVFGDITGNCPSVLESSITLSDYDDFYGDLVEFNPYTFEEKRLMSVYYRFNTAQRETTNEKYFDINTNNILADDFDIYSSFTVSSITLNRVESGETKDKKFPGNINPEGYIYQPHYKIKIKEMSDSLSSSPAYIINADSKTGITIEKEKHTTYNEYTGEIKEEELHVITITPPISGEYEAGMRVMFYNKAEQTDFIWTKIYEVSGDTNMKLKVVAEKETDKEFYERISGDTYTLVLSKENIPSYAIFQPQEQQFIWRDVITPSEVSQKSDIYDMPYTNGRFYVNKNVNFFLKRQDPFGAYKISSYEQDGVYNPLKSFRVKGNLEVDLSGIIYLEEDIVGNC